MITAAGVQVVLSESPVEHEEDECYERPGEPTGLPRSLVGYDSKGFFEKYVPLHNMNFARCPESEACGEDARY